MTRLAVPKPAPRHSVEWAFLLTGPERDVDLLAQNAARGGNCSPRVVRGQRCQSEAALFKEWSAALQFPYYFGNNWDAFEECVNDLNWIPGRGHLILIANAHRVLPGPRERFDLLTEILANAAAHAYVAGGAADGVRPLSVVFHSPTHAGDTVLQRLDHVSPRPADQFRPDR